MPCVETTQGTRLIDSIPDPEEVRTRLVACTKEAAVLRGLLRVAERVKRDRNATCSPRVVGLHKRSRQ
jgi:hypothetical protein